MNGGCPPDGASGLTHADVHVSSLDADLDTWTSEFQTFFACATIKSAETRQVHGQTCRREQRSQFQNFYHSSFDSSEAFAEI
jgi:hypothetical protein